MRQGAGAYLFYYVSGRLLSTHINVLSKFYILYVSSLSFAFFILDIIISRDAILQSYILKMCLNRLTDVCVD